MLSQSSLRRAIWMWLLVGVMVVSGCSAQGIGGSGSPPSAGPSGGSGAACKASLSGYVAALQEISSRIKTSITVLEYGSRIGDAQVASDSVSRGSLALGCAAVATELDQVLTEHIAIQAILLNCAKYPNACKDTSIQLGKDRAAVPAMGAQAETDFAKAKSDLEALGSP